MLKLVRLVKQVRIGAATVGPDIPPSANFTIDIDWKQRFVNFTIPNKTTVMVPFEQVLGLEFDAATPQEVKAK